MGYIDKDKFCKIMDNFMDARQAAGQVDQIVATAPVLRDSADFFSATSLIMANEPVVVDLLMEMFDDKDEWIEYWMYEQEFGRKWDHDIAHESDGTEIYLPTAGALYDYLVQNIEA